MQQRPTSQANTGWFARRKWWVVGTGAVVCLLSWLAMGIGLALGVEFTTRLVLVTIAAVATEALIWLTAGAFGLSVFEARRSIWRYLRDAPKRWFASR